MLYLKQSTASQAVLLGPFIDDTDGATAETGLTIANTDIRLSKNGGNMVAKNSGGGTHDENGYYTITLDATDTNTVGRLQISCKVAGALAVFQEYQVLEETVYDALFASGAAGELLVALSTQGKADVNAECDTALTDYDAATGAEVAALNDPTAAEIADAVWDEATTGHTTAGTFGEQVKTDIDAILTDTGTTLDGKLDTIDGIVDAILVDTDTTIPGLIAALNNISTADVNAQVLDVLNTDTFAEPTGVPGATVTLAAKIGFLYMVMRNKKTVTATKKTVFDDSGTAEFEYDLSDDGTTYTESEANAI